MMNRERALEIAREVKAGKTRSYVGAATALAEYLIEQEDRASAAKLNAAPAAVGLPTPRSTQPWIDVDPPTERELDRPRAGVAPLRPSVPPEARTEVLGVTISGEVLRDEGGEKG